MRPPARAVTAAFVAALAAGCGPAIHHTVGPPAPGTPPASTPTASQPAAGRVVPPPPPRPWQPPPAAVATGAAYVTTALSYSWNDPPDAWLNQVRPFCTPEWAAALAADADGGAGGWAGIIADRQSARARVLAVYPSASPGPGRRLEVTARVTVTGTHPATIADALAVDLLPQAGGTWLVTWAG